LIKKFVSIGLFLKHNKSGLIISITASTIVALAFLFIPPLYNDQIPEPEPPITQKEAVGMLINKLELEENPYNANAHMILGQMYMVFGNYRGALNEFNEAGNIDETLADPHFGIGYVFYDLAILDMIKRNLYEIYEPGIIYKVETIDSNNSNLPLIYYPSVMFHPDKRARTIFTMSLKEFNKGMTLQQFYRYDTNTKRVMIQ
jgi:tetratricopeptide (TPR) repeat protein